MELSLFVAKLLSVTYFAAAFGALTNKINFKDMMKSFEKSPGLTFVSGFFTLLVGMIVVTMHNTWENNWTTLVTIVGWISVVKGVLLMAMPDVISSTSKMFKNNQVWGVIMVVAGAVFGYFGFLG